MANPLDFKQDKDLIDMGLFRDAQYNLPDIVLSINLSDPFVAARDGQIVAQCLAKANDESIKITHFAYTDLDGAYELLRFVAGCYKETSELNFLDIGCGNAKIDLLAVMQRAGYRIVGVDPDYYLDDTKTVEVENSIVNRDLLRLRYNLREKTLSTIGYDASGRTD